jgi:hypothetical protein
MALRGDEFISAIRSRGVPEAWQEFGWLLSHQASLSTQLVAAAGELRASGPPYDRQLLDQLLDDLDKNLGRARTVVDEVLARYDASDRWERLDAAVHGMEVDDVVAALAPHLSLHQFPAVVESLRFNYRYVLEHGYRAFYEMTGEYLAKLADLLASACGHLQAVDWSGPFPPWDLFRLDLVMIEVPIHCDVCRNVAAYGEYSLEQADR